MRRRYLGCLLLAVSCKGSVPPAPILPPDAAPDGQPPIVCFAAGTRIATPTGEVAIETLHPGDPVLAFDVRAQRVVPSRVSAVQAHAGRLAGRLVAGGRILHLTSEHPIFLPARAAFVPARELPAGSALLALGARGTVHTPLAAAFAIPAGEAPQTVYDLTVDDQHDYFAEGILVHNKQPPPMLPACPKNPTSHVDRAEAAARLGRWLWNDDGGGAVAEADRLGLDLTSRADLDTFVERLLADPRAAAGFDAFLQSWLALDRKPPSALVPEPLWSSFREETRRFLWQVLMQENGGPKQVLLADYTVVDEGLAAHYELPAVTGWTKVRVDPRLRGGLLGQGSLLAQYPSAPGRGRFVVERLQECAQFPTPPAAHPAPNPRTPARSAVVAELGQNPVCGACHSIVDGPGWTLQNYDELARYRTVDADGAAVDPTGWLVRPQDVTRVEVSSRLGLAEALAVSGETTDCFILQVARHAVARAEVVGLDLDTPRCHRDFWSAGQGFHELLHGVAATVILDWPRPDAGF